MKEYFRLKMKIISKSLGSYLIPGILLALMFIALLTVGFSINKNILIQSTQWIIFSICSSGFSIIVGCYIYYVQIVYFEDRNNGIQYLMQSKPVSKKQIFFGNLFAISIPTFAIGMVIFIDSIIFFSIINSNFLELVKKSSIIFISTILFVIVLVPFGYAIAPKISRKVFGTIIMIPLFVGYATYAGKSIEGATSPKNHALELTKTIGSSKQFLPTKPLEENINNYNHIEQNLNERNRKDYYFTYKIDNKIYNNQKIPYAPFYIWISPVYHLNQIYSKIMNDYNDSQNLYIKQWDQSINKNDYLTLKIKNNNLGKEIDYSLLEIFDNSNNKEFNQKINYDILRWNNLIKQHEDDINKYEKPDSLNPDKVKHAKNEIKKLKETIQFFEKNTSILNIRNSNEFRNLVLETFNSIDKKLDKVHGDFGDFVRTKSEIELKIIDPYYKNNELLYEKIISKNSLAILLTTVYYSKNKEKLKEIKLPLIKDKNKNDFSSSELFKIKDFTSKFDESKVSSENGIIKYEFLETDAIGAAKIKIKEYVPSSISFILPFIFGASLLALAYFVHTRKAFIK